MVTLPPRVLAPHRGGGNPGLPLSEKASRFSAARCVLFCRVLAVGLLAFGVKVSDRISAPVALHRLSTGSVGRARRGRNGGLFAVSTLAWEVEAESEVSDFFSASIGSRFFADRASAERLGDGGPLWRRCGDWGL